MTQLPQPAALDLPPGAVIAVPAAGMTVYRLVTTDPPTLADFRIQSPERAAIAGWPELLRVGLSHFTAIESARRVRLRRSSLIARVELLPDRGIHVARTGGRRGHVTVWARPSELIAEAHVVHD